MVHPNPVVMGFSKFIFLSIIEIIVSLFRISYGFYTKTKFNLTIITEPTDEIKGFSRSSTSDAPPEGNQIMSWSPRVLNFSFEIEDPYFADNRRRRSRHH